MDSSILSELDERGSQRRLRRRKRAGETADTSLSDAIFDRLKAEGFVVIRGSITKGGGTGYEIEIEDSLDEFVRCSKSLGISAIVVQTLTLDDEDFYSDFESGGADGTDLRDTDRRLSRYEGHLGSCWLAEAIGLFGYHVLTHRQVADWFDEFARIRDEAIEALEGAQEDAREERQRDSAERNANALAAIRALVKDADFLEYVGPRPTQRAVMAYIRENIADSLFLMRGELHNEVVKLCDKLVVARAKRGGLG